MEILKILLEQFIALITIFKKRQPSLSIDERIAQILLIREEMAKSKPDMAIIEYRGRLLFNQSIPPTWLIFFLEHSEKPISDLESFAYAKGNKNSPSQKIMDTFGRSLTKKWLGTLLQITGSIIIIATFISVIVCANKILLNQTHWKQLFIPCISTSILFLVGIYFVRVGMYSDRFQQSWDTIITLVNKVYKK